MINVIFLGPPGSGKGTQATILANNLEIPTISTGDALRREVENESEIGKMAKGYMTSGQLVPDEVVINIIKNRITQEDCSNGFIVDGFPRNISQAKSFDQMLKTVNRKIDIVFNFEVNDDILVKRISGRFSCKECGALYNRYFKTLKKEGVCDSCNSSQFLNRADDNENTVKSRLEVFHGFNGDLTKYYKKNNLLYSIDAVQSVPFVSERLIEISKKFLSLNNN